MHQQSRHPPRGSSPASNPQTNPTRTNNPRDTSSAHPRPSSESPAPAPSIPVGGGDASQQPAAVGPRASSVSGGPSRESMKKLDQIIQNFHLKAAVLIIQARIPVTPAGGGRGKKTNKWFQIETDDIDDFKDELRTWKYCGSFDNRPPPMVIETYLDASRLSPGQALVVVDENGKRYDALDALNTAEFAGGSDSSHGSGRSDSNKIRTRSTEIIIERWKVELQCIPSLSKSGSAGSGGGSSGGVGASSGSGEGGGDKAREGASGISAADAVDMDDFGPILPTIYKRSIVFFRSLFVTTHVLPAYRFSRQVTSKGVHPALKVRCRVLTGAAAEARISSTGFDNLRQPLVYDGARDVVTDYMFGDLEVPVGRFSASVTYRNDCSFRVVDSESLLSSRFMGIDENYFRPSLPQTQRTDNAYLAQPFQHQQPFGQPHSRRDSSAEVVGSLPSQHRHARNVVESRYEAPQPQQTYGSLSTFHGAGALGTSPLSALKAVRPMGSESSSPTDSVRPSSIDHRPHVEPPSSLPIHTGHHMAAAAAASSGGRPPTLRNLEGIGRRTSVSFQPFKAGSLSASPRLNQEEMPSSPLSGSRPASGLSSLAHARQGRNSLTAGMAASLRGAPIISTSAGSSAAASSSTAAAAMMIDPGQSSSPRPSAGSRYSSSFTHRRAKSSFGGASRNEDEQGSSGRQSLSSSVAQPGSGLLAELGGAGSSGSYQTDDDNISDFLKALESKKTLQSFEVSSRRGESARRTAAQLSRFQMMRESNVALTDSMNSSMQLQAKSPTSNRPFHSSSGASGVSATSSTSGSGTAGTTAAALPGGSMSTSMSPNKPHSPNTPHTQHTPAVPSRLSENSIIDYQGQAQTRARTGREVASTAEEGETDSKEGGGGTTAIDIPLSPRLRQNDRRSSSAAQKSRALIVDDDADLAAFGGQRSLSVGADNRDELPSPNALFRLEQEGPDTGGRGATAGTTAGTSGTVSAGVTGSDPKTATDLASASMPPTSAAVAAAIRSAAGSGASQRRRYIGRHQQQAQQSDTPGTHGSDGRPTPPASTRASISGSFMGRYGSGRGSGVTSGTPSGLIGPHAGASTSTGGGTGGEGEADGEPLVFDLSELGQPNRHSLEEPRGTGSAEPGSGASGGGPYAGHHRPW